MRGLLADVNCEAHVGRLLTILRSDDWLAIWESYGLVVETFAGLGLDREAVDRVVWERCQAEGLALITINRNDNGSDSLEAAIRDGAPDALPVYTISRPRAVLDSPVYARKIASVLMNEIDDLTSRPEIVLGSGRIYLPRKPYP